VKTALAGAVAGSFVRASFALSGQQSSRVTNLPRTIRTAAYSFWQQRDECR